MSYTLLMIQLSQNLYDPRNYPLGLGYLSNSLRQNGYEAEFLDLWAHPEEGSRFDFDLHKFDAVCIAFYATQYRQLRSICKAIRNHNPAIPIIVGGPGAKPSYKILMQELPIDFIVFEEAEISLPNLLRQIFCQRGYQNVKGIAYREKDSVIATEPQSYIKDLDNLEIPDRECLDFQVYSQGSGMPGMTNGVEANVITGRGCPYTCTFCSKTFKGCRQRSVGNVINEILHLKQKYNVQSIIFNDELVITSKRKVLELSEALKPLCLKWGCQGRVNLMDKEMLDAMRDSGCVYIGYGFENATQKMLDAMKKRIKVEDMVRVYRMTREAGIIPIVQYMYGFVGEDEESLQNSVKFFETIDHPAVGFYVQPVPGTELYSYCLAEGHISDETKYLDEFDLGYNRSECVINLSRLQDVDTLNRRIRETRRIIDINYYRKHPLKCAKKVWDCYRTNGKALLPKVYHLLRQSSIAASRSNRAHT